MCSCSCESPVEVEIVDTVACAREFEDVRERFSTFYARRPHPVFVRFPGYAKWSNAVPYYPEFKISQEEINALVAYAESLRIPQE